MGGRVQHVLGENITSQLVENKTKQKKPQVHPDVGFYELRFV